MILVLGATGTTGGEVARQLIVAGRRPRILVRDPGKARAFEGRADIEVGDLDSRESMETAMRGVESVYLVSSGPEMVSLERNVLDAAVTAGVRHVVKLSVITADAPQFTFARWHRDAERSLMTSGLAWTMIRPGNFMTNTLGWSATIKAQGAFHLPTATGRWASIDPADIGAMAVAALTRPGHEGKAYTITGSASMDGAGYAAVISRVIGKPVNFVDVPREKAEQGMMASGMPAAYVAALLDLLDVMKSGGANIVTDTIEKVLGRPPVPFEDWVRRNISAFK